MKGAFKRITVVINASAGAGDRTAVAEKLAATLQSAGVDGNVVLARSGAEVRSAAQAAAKGQSDVVVAGGGDGTINTVATALVGTDIALGVLPLGTLNHFAKDLGISLDMDVALRDVIAGHTAQVDVGEVNGHYFLNNSSIGIYPRIVRDREQLQRAGQRKWIAFIGAVIPILRRHSFMHVRVSADGVDRMRRTPFVFVGNNEYQMEGFNMGTRARLDAGCLSVYSVRHERRWGLLRLAVRALFGRLRTSGDFDGFCTSALRIESQRRHMHVALDGEVVRMDAPLNYRVRAGALRVIVPEGSACVR